MLKATNKVNGLLGLATKAGKIVFGTDSIEEAIYKKKIRLVIIASDSSEKTINKMKELCEKNNVICKIYGNIEENSRAIGKANKAIIGIKDINFSKVILKEICGGDTIG